MTTDAVLTCWETRAFLAVLRENISRNIYLSIYLSIYLCKLPRNVATARLLHPWSEDRHGQETFLAPSANNIKPAALTPSA